MHERETEAAVEQTFLFPGAIPAEKEGAERAGRRASVFCRLKWSRKQSRRTKGKQVAEAKQQKTAYSARTQQNRRFLLYLLLVLLGTLFCVWYIHSAACDVIYSDYVRLVDSYLPDVTNPAKFFVPDVLTRIPAAFLQRIVNVKLFAFSVTFDRLCGAAGLFLCGAVLARYAARERIGFGIYFLMMIVLFSLIKWEILLNGSAWAHVVSFGLFFLNYYLLDRVFQERCGEKKAALAAEAGDRAAFDGGGDCSARAVQKQGKKHAEKFAPYSVKTAMLCMLPFVILMFAGEYIAAYTGGLILAYAYCMLRSRQRSRASDKKNGSTDQTEAGKASTAGNGGAREANLKMWILCLLCSVLPLLFYLLSRHFAVWEHAGATSLSFSEAMAQEPLFLPRFFIKTFAGAVLGQESIQALTERQVFSDGTVLLLGLMVILAYLFAIILYFRAGLYKKTIFPMTLLLTGGMNHVLVTLSRWIFLKESYALSSRYAGQFMIGILGILLIFGLWLREQRGKAQPKRIVCKGILSLFCILFLTGNCYTTKEEIQKAPYREQNYEALSVMLRNYREYPEDALRKGLEWNKDAETMYSALEILEENHLNVFRE